MPMNSTHKVEVILIEEILPHANADFLEVIPIWDYQCCVAKGSFKVGDLAAYIPPDSVVKTSRSEFAFLTVKPEQTTARIKPKKLRGVWSMGLLLPAPIAARKGDDVAELLEVTHYEPPLKLSRNGSRPGCSLASGPAASPPPGNRNICYDLEAWRRYGKKTFRDGECVVVTEKIHGANARYVWSGGKLHCGSRKQWKQEYSKLPAYEEILKQVGDEIRAFEIHSNLLNRPKVQDLWWRAIGQYPDTIEWLKAHPGYTLYGEVFGQVQDLTYGTQSGEIRLAFFDVLSPDGKWMDYSYLRLAATISCVPEVFVGPYDAEHIASLASGKSLVDGAHKQMREGVVIRPWHERSVPHCGRAVLKLVSNEYLAR